MTRPNANATPDATPGAATRSMDEAHFTINYYQARALFRRRVQEAGLALHTLQLRHIQDMELSIDATVVAGQAESVLVHISGTHGVEGHAGSAIQSAVLQRLQQWAVNGGPTVVVVHALNPYGYAELRRFNEHNVDLNRNSLSTAAFQRKVENDPNATGYVDMFALLNPTPSAKAATSGATFWTRAAWQFLRRGALAIKRATVSGNYHYPEGIFYGGTEMEPSLVLLHQFLQEQLTLERVQQLVVVDVHTGLGESGVDTIMVMPGSNDALARQLFAQEDAVKRVASLSDTSNPVTKGYESAAGSVAAGLLALLPETQREEVVAINQEFGTESDVAVLKAMVDENAFFQYAPSRRLPASERLRDVFYVHRSRAWKQSIVTRGLAVFEEVYAHLTAKEASSRSDL